MSPRGRAPFAVALAALLGTGCIGGIRAGEVPQPQAPGQIVEGLRYFLPAPYLVIEQTADGQWDANIQSVVDRSREYYVQPFAYLSSGKAKVEFEDDGTLKTFRLESDSTAVPEAVINAAKDVQLKRDSLRQAEIEARGKAGAGFTAPKQLMDLPDGGRAIFLYRIEGARLVGVSGPTAVVGLVSKRRAAPDREIPESLSPGLEVVPGDTDPKTQIALGIKGVQLTKDLGARRLRFLTSLGDRRVAVTPERHKALVDGAKEVAGRMVFLSADLWDVTAVDLVP